MQDLNFIDLCSGVGIVWSTTNRTQVNDITAVTFSVKCFNPLKLYPPSRNIFKSCLLHTYYLLMNI